MLGARSPDSGSPLHRFEFALSNSATPRMISATLRRGVVAFFAGALLTACTLVPPPEPPAESLPLIDHEIYRRAEVDRSDRLQAEIGRLRADLQKAEEALILAESGMRGTYSRADAVSALAESRIEVERVALRAPWRGSEIDEARSKLDEAGRQITQSHFGAALFFIHRAQRMAMQVDREAQAVAATRSALFVRSKHANLRAGPSTADDVVQVLAEGVPVFPEERADGWVLVRASTGSVGWIHSSLVGTARDAR